MAATGVSNLGMLTREVSAGEEVDIANCFAGVSCFGMLPPATVGN